jgi:MYXO-CTERM domain-containing protein
MMKRTVRLASLLVTMFAGSIAFAGGHDLPGYDAYFDAPDALLRPLSSAALTPAMVAGVSSIDEKRGVPTVFVAPANGPMVPAEYLTRPEASARFYLEQYAGLYGLGSGALVSAYVAMIHDTGRGGIIVVFRQKAAGIDVHQVAVKVLMTRTHELVAITGNLHPRAAATMTRSAKFVQSPQSAISRAFNDFFGAKVPASAFLDTKKLEHGYSFYNLEDTPETIAKNIGLARPARIKKVYFAMPDALVPAYYVEIAGSAKTSTSSVLYSYVMAADDGRMLQRRSLTHEAAFQYRVWSDAAPYYTPTDGPQVDFTPHPTGVPDGSAPAFSLPTMVTVDGFNKNPMNTFDPWLAAGATQTNGNNVDAYVDRNAPDGFGGMDFRATTTSTGVFDRTYNTAQSPTVNQNQQRASITQLFYDNNYYHDYWYDSGFNEAAGNAQVNNFGRGGLGNDAIKAEGQDYSGTDNANMQTPADGSAPIMQMYIFSGTSNTSLTVNPGNTPYSVGVADFGPQTFNIGPAQMVAAVDNSTADSMGGNTGTFADACQALTGGSGAYAGKIVLADRGSCNFTVKVKNIQNAGGVGAIIANNAAGLPPNPMSGTDNTITIGVQGVSQATGTTLKQQIQMGMITGTMVRGASLQRDGTIDNGIIAHEWGHFIHNRLSSPGTQQGGAMGEGWGDFQAMMQSVRANDNTGASFSGVFATGIYASATFGDSAYYGIRRVPYSKNFVKNGLTFKHIGDSQTLPPGMLDFANNAEVHNAGEVWCQMMWEGYSNLLDDTLGAAPRHTFDQAKRKMADYVVGGLKLAPGNMTFTEQRDGILLTAIAAGKTSGDYSDFQDLAAGFATRGAGSCAVSPARNSMNLDGVVESFTANPEPVFISASVVETSPSCDTDGVLDAGETGRVAITIQNVGWSDLTGATITVTSTDPNLTFPNGNDAMVPTTAVFANGVASVDVKLAGGISATTVIPLNVVINAPAACSPMITAPGSAEVHFDSIEPNTADAATTETFEGLTKTWAASLGSGGATQLWSIIRPVATGLNEMIWGQDVDSVSDHRYESPDLVVGAGAFSMTFQNRYQFERSQNTNWDGAVIEYSEDGGMTWADVNTLGGVNPGYNGTIGNMGSNPLGGRQGYTDATTGFANGMMVGRTIDFGTTLANKTVKLRFRIGTDEAEGSGGWYIDDIAFTGLSNKPFSAQVADDGMCENMPPISNAGVDQVVPSGANVILDGTGSSDPDNAPNPLTYAWTQPTGPGVTLSMPAGSKTNFVAPSVMMDTVLTFQLTVNDGAAMATDTVDVLVQAEVGTSSSSGMGGTGGMGTGGNAEGGAGGSRPPLVIDEGGCECSVPGSGNADPLRDAGGSLLALFGAWLVRRRRNGKPS